MLSRLLIWRCSYRREATRAGTTVGGRLTTQPITEAITDVNANRNLSQLDDTKDEVPSIQPGTQIHVPILAVAQDHLGKREAGTHHRKGISLFNIFRPIATRVALSSVSYMRVVG